MEDKVGQSVFEIAVRLRWLIGEELVIKK